MTSLVFSPIESLHDAESVFRVDAQKFQQYETDRPTLGSGTGSGAPPQFSIDAAKHIAHHGFLMLRMKRARMTRVISMLPAGCVDVAEIAQ